MNIQPFRDFEPDTVFTYGLGASQFTPMNTQPIGDFDPNGMSPVLPTTFSQSPPDGGFRLQPLQDFWKADLQRQHYGAVLKGIITFEELEGRFFTILPEVLTDEQAELFKKDAMKVSYEDPHFGDKGEFWVRGDGQILVGRLDVKK